MHTFQAPAHVHLLTPHCLKQVTWPVSKWERTAKLYKLRGKSMNTGKPIIWKFKPINLLRTYTLVTVN